MLAKCLLCISPVLQAEASRVHKQCKYCNQCKQCTSSASIASRAQAVHKQCTNSVQASSASIASRAQAVQVVQILQAVHKQAPAAKWAAHWRAARTKSAHNLYCSALSFIAIGGWILCRLRECCITGSHHRNGPTPVQQPLPCQTVWLVWRTPWLIQSALVPIHPPLCLKT